MELISTPAGRRSNIISGIASLLLVVRLPRTVCWRSSKQIFDPLSRRRRDMVQPGRRCLEVGAGRGSMAVWLAQRVGPSGHVVGSPIDSMRAMASDASCDASRTRP